MPAVGKGPPAASKSQWDLSEHPADSVHTCSPASSAFFSRRPLFPPPWLLSVIPAACEEGVGSPLAILSDTHSQESVTQALPSSQDAPLRPPLDAVAPMVYPLGFYQRSTTSRKGVYIKQSVARNWLTWSWGLTSLKSVGQARLETLGQELMLQSTATFLLPQGNLSY